MNQPVQGQGPSPLGFSSPKVQRLRRLLGRRAARLDEGAFVIEGAKIVEEAFVAGADVEAVYITAGFEHPVLAHAARLCIPVIQCASGVLARVGDTVTPQDIVAVASLQWSDRADVIGPLRAGGFALVAVDVNDPGNAGTLLRSAEVCGACVVVFTGSSVDPSNPKVVRASAGALFHVPVIVEREAANTLRWLHDAGVRTWATTVSGHGVTPLGQTDLRGPTAILVGNEAHGLESAVAREARERCTIPMVGRTESLNVAMAATIVAYEAARQRGTPVTR